MPRLKEVESLVVLALDDDLKLRAVLSDVERHLVYDGSEVGRGEALRVWLVVVFRFPASEMWHTTWE